MATKMVSPIERNGLSALMATLKTVVNFAMRPVFFEEVAFQCVSNFSSCDHHISLSILRQMGHIEDM